MRSKPPDAAADGGVLPGHLETIQRQLGGSVVDQFDALRADAPGAPAWWRQFRGSLDANGARPAPRGSFGTPTWGATWSETSNATTDSGIVPAAAQAPAVPPYAPPAYAAPAYRPAGSDPARVITALREVAARLDVAANRLEGLELYQQADALREQARALRMDARRKSPQGGAIAPTPAFPTPPTPYSPQPTPTAPTSDSPPRTGWHYGWSSEGVTSGPTLGATIAPGDPSREPGDPPVWTGDADRAASQTVPPADVTPQPDVRPR